MSSLDRFNTGFKQAIARNKKKAIKAPVQAAHTVPKVNDNSSNAVATTALKFKGTTAKVLSDEQYRVNIINLAIARIKMKWSI